MVESHKTLTRILEDLWALAQLDREALNWLTLTGQEPAIPSSFRIGAAAQVCIATASLAAAEIRHARGLSRQKISVDMRHAVKECGNFFSLDGLTPEVWDKLSGLYPCGPNGEGGWVRIHANFKHHREGALRLLVCPSDSSASRADVVKALLNWDAEEFESAAENAELAVTAVRNFDQWDAHPQGVSESFMPLFRVKKKPIRDRDDCLHSIRKAAPWMVCEFWI